MRNQYEILRNMQTKGFNVCTCGNCGDVVLFETEEIEIECPHCGYSSESCDFPDLYHEFYKTCIISKPKIVNATTFGRTEWWFFQVEGYRYSFEATVRVRDYDGQRTLEQIFYEGGDVPDIVLDVFVEYIKTVDHA